MSIGRNSYPRTWERKLTSQAGHHHTISSGDLGNHTVGRSVADQAGNRGGRGPHVGDLEKVAEVNWNYRQE